MKEVNLWDTDLFSKFFECYTNIEDILKLIEDGRLGSFYLKDSFVMGDEINYPWEQKLDENIKINYTDMNHPLIRAKDIVRSSMCKEFFNLHKKEICDAYLRYYREHDQFCYYIPDYLFSDELLDVLLQKDDAIIHFKNVYLTSEQIEKIRDKHIEVFAEYDNEKIQVSSRYVLLGYTIKSLQETDEIIITFKDIDDIKDYNLKFIAPNTKIKFLSFSFLGDDVNEEEKLRKISELAIKLNSLNKNITFSIPITRRSVFNKYFKNLNLSNVNIIISNDLYDYSHEEYLREEEKLDKLVEPIVNSDMSSFEKYMAVYNIVKNFKPYKENKDSKDQSRYLRYILDNDYMVCVGYAKLLNTLLDKVGIRSVDLSVAVDTSYDDGFTQEEKEVDLNGHARVLVSIDDDKYNIHGLYVSDPTWDNELSKNYVNHALMTIDKMTISRRMFEYNRVQPILDIHNFDEFNMQVNYLLKKELSSVLSEKKARDITKKDISNAYKTVCCNILQGIKCDPKYEDLVYSLSNCVEEEDYVNFLTFLGKYLLKRINKPVDHSIIINACMVADKRVKGIDDDYEEMEKEFLENEKKLFPYELSDLESHNLNSVQK